MGPIGYPWLAGVLIQVFRFGTENYFSPRSLRRRAGELKLHIFTFGAGVACRALLTSASYTYTRVWSTIFVFYLMDFVSGYDIFRSWQDHRTLIASGSWEYDIIRTWRDHGTLVALEVS